MSNWFCWLLSLAVYSAENSEARKWSGNGRRGALPPCELRLYLPAYGAPLYLVTKMIDQVGGADNDHTICFSGTRSGRRSRSRSSSTRGRYRRRHRRRRRRHCRRLGRDGPKLEHHLPRLARRRQAAPCLPLHSTNRR
jgi:hypothetical protein